MRIGITTLLLGFPSAIFYPYYKFCLTNSALYRFNDPNFAGFNFKEANSGAGCSHIAFNLLLLYFSVYFVFTGVVVCLVC